LPQRACSSEVAELVLPRSTATWSSETEAAVGSWTRSRSAAAWTHWASSPVLNDAPSQLLFEVKEPTRLRSKALQPSSWGSLRRALRFLERAFLLQPLPREPQPEPRALQPERTWPQQAPEPHSDATQSSHLRRQPRCTLQLTRQKQGDSKA